MSQINASSAKKAALLYFSSPKDLYQSILIRNGRSAQIFLYQSKISLTKPEMIGVIRVVKKEISLCWLPLLHVVFSTE